MGSIVGVIDPGPYFDSAARIPSGFLSEYRMLAFGTVLVMMMVFRPGGIVSGKCGLPIQSGRPIRAANGLLPGNRHDYGTDTRRKTADHGFWRPPGSRRGSIWTVRKGEIVALIGPNGAGKTTFFNCITGIYDPTGGDVLIAPPEKGGCSASMASSPTRSRKKGMARTFQNIRLFQNMTVLENVMIGRHCRMKAGILGAVLRGPPTRREEKEVVQKSYRSWKKSVLNAYVNDFAKNLPYGAQRRLEIARAMATEPFMLLLDEPAAGMNPQETQELDDLIINIREKEGYFDPAHRARHETGHEPVRPDFCHGLW
jgi:ABC-type branched-subunit amino acid transport system ATPase component